MPPLLRLKEKEMPRKARVRAPPQMTRKVSELILRLRETPYSI
jgi:hypothetical protein